MKRIIIINSGFCFNKGDAAILYGAITALNKYFGFETKYSIESAWGCYKKTDSLKYLKNQLQPFPPLWKSQTTFLCKIKHIPIPNIFFLLEWITKLPVIIEMYGFKKLSYSKFLLSKSNQELIKQMENADIVISCAGGSFHDLEGGSNFLKLLYSLYIATKSSAHVMIYAQSIGPFNNSLYKKMTKKVLNEVDLITVRDYYSKEYLQKMGIKTSVKVTADAAFSLDDPNQTDFITDINVCLKKYSWIKSSGINIGITIRSWEIKDYNEEMCIRKMAKLVEKICSNYNNVIITFFPQVAADISISKQICRCSGFVKEKCFVVEEKLHPMVLKGLYGKMSLFIGTRMHSTIFSLSMDVPTISIAYMPKSIDLMKRFKLEDFTFSISDFDEEDMLKKIDYILQEQSIIKTHIQKYRMDMYNKSMENAELAYELSRGNLS